ncbi:TPA: M48 family metalloprotease [Citrobacter gillenii]
MERKGTLHLFAVPTGILIYALWQCWRAGYFNDGNAEAVLRLMLALLAITLAGAALLIVGAAVGLCTTSARASRHSQSTLIRTFTRCRRLLPFMMAAEIVACGLAVIALALSEIIWIASHIGGEGGFKLAVIILMAIGAIVWMLFKSLSSIRRCFALFQPDDTEICGVNVTAANNPALWQWIGDITRHAELTVPDNIVVGFFDGFFATANAVQIEEGKRLTGNTLYLPLTYMALLDEAEAAAVIGHELGHFTGEDTQYSLRFVPLYAGMQNSLEQMANSSQGFSWLDRIVLRPSLDMGLWFLQTFHETVSDWSRLREYAADETGAKVSSPAAFASALLRISALEVPVSQFFAAIFRGREASANWLAYLVAELQGGGQFALHNSINNEIAHPMDSHPTTRDRIASLGVALDDELLARAARPVVEGDNPFFRRLFPDADALCTSLSRMMSANVTSQRENYRQALEAEAQQATDSVALWMSAKPAWYMMAAGLFLLLGGVALVVFKTVSVWCWLIPFGGIAFGLLGIITLRRTRQPLLVLTQEAIVSPWLPQPLPLKNIADYNLTIISSSMTIEFFMDDDYQPNLTTKRFMQVIRFNPRKHAVAIVVAGDVLRQQENGKVKLDAQALLTLIGQYIVSAHARAELEDF